MNIADRINEATTYLKDLDITTPKVAIILGSGLGDFAKALEEAKEVKYKDIPGFPISTVIGHEGSLYFGCYQNIQVMLMSGRFHYYEGYSQKEITIPVRVMKNLGIETLIITNAAGGINKDFKEGALMLINDHINLSGSNPLMGPNLDDFGTRFPDMSDVYSKELREKLFDAAKEEGLILTEGIYAMMSGPSFETPAEIKYLRTIGADAVGMSTVPEAIVASHCNMRVLGISCITNMAAGILNQKLTHEEVFETAQRVKTDFKKILELCIVLSSKKEV